MLTVSGKTVWTFWAIKPRWVLVSPIMLKETLSSCIILSSDPFNEVIFSFSRSSEASVMVPVYSISPVTSSSTEGLVMAIPNSPAEFI